jgi:hypothetical protein
MVFYAVLFQADCPFSALPQRLKPLPSVTLAARLKAAPFQEAAC